MRSDKKEKLKYFEKLKHSARPLLWEYNIRELKDSEIKDLIMERIMQFGNMKQIQMMMRVFSFDDIALFFAKEGWKNFSNVDFNFWYYILRDYKKKEINWNQILHQRQLLRSRYTAWKH